MNYFITKVMCRRIVWSYSINKVRQSQGIAARMLYQCSAPLQSRHIHYDIKRLTDKIKDTNPFFDKYSEKIKKVGGYVWLV